MKLRRGNDSTLTCMLEPEDYIESWKATYSIHLDGTKDKSGSKDTNLYLEIEEKDVFALFEALISKLRAEREELESLRSENLELHLKQIRLDL